MYAQRGGYASIFIFLDFCPAGIGGRRTWQHCRDDCSTWRPQEGPGSQRFRHLQRLRPTAHNRRFCKLIHGLLPIGRGNIVHFVKMSAWKVMSHKSEGFDKWLYSLNTVTALNPVYFCWMKHFYPRLHSASRAWNQLTEPGHFPLVDYNVRSETSDPRVAAFSCCLFRHFTNSWRFGCADHYRSPRNCFWKKSVKVSIRECWKLCYDSFWGFNFWR